MTQRRVIIFLVVLGGVALVPFAIGVLANAPTTVVLLLLVGPALPAGLAARRDLRRGRNGPGPR